MRRGDEVDETLGFSQFFAVLRRQRRVVCGAVLAGVVAAGIFLVASPRTITATTSLNLNVITTEPFNQQRPASGLLDPQTEADIASSHVVAVEASKLLDGLLAPNEVRAASEVTAPGGASVVKVAFTGTSEDQAVQGADAVARAYLGYRSDQAKQRIETMLTSMNDRIDTLDAALLDANQAMVAADPKSTAYAQALSQQQQLQSELDSMLSQRNALSNVDTTGGVILTSARDSEFSTHPSTRTTLATGLAAGLVIGIIAAFVWNPRDRRLRTISDIAAVVGAPLLARLTARRGGPLSDAAVQEEMRIVRERLLGALGGGGRVLLFDARRSEEPSRAARELDAVSGDELKLETIEAGANTSGCLAALRAAEGVVLICSPRTALTTDLGWVREEADLAEAPIIGFVVEA